MAAKVVKMCDMKASIAMKVFQMLNPEKVTLKEHLRCDGIYIYTDTEPKDLIYPEGWYYAKGAFRNKHQSTTGLYSEVLMFKNNGELWEEYAHYCTLYDK